MNAATFFGIHGLGKLLRLAHQLASAPGPTRPEMAQHPRRMARSPDERRAAGTGFWLSCPVHTAYSNNPRTVAIRRFIVAGEAPGPAKRTTLPPFLGRRACQSR